MKNYFKSKTHKYIVISGLFFYPLYMIFFGVSILSVIMLCVFIYLAKEDLI